MSNTRELLAEYALLLNTHGVNSDEAERFLEDHRFNDEFYELAVLSRKLKLALTTPSCNHICN